MWGEILTENRKALAAPLQVATEVLSGIARAIEANDEDEVMLISTGGTLVRVPVAEVSVQGRNTQGVRLIRLDDGDRLVGLDRIMALAEEE